MALSDLIKLCIFDLDGTIVQYTNGPFQSSWDAIGIAAGKEKEWVQRRDYYYPRPELYQEWFDGNCRLLEGIEVQPILRQIFPPPYTPGFLEFCAYLKREGIRTGIVSSGVDIVANRVLQEAGLNFAIANVLNLEKDRFTGTGEQHVPLWDKGKYVNQQMLHHGASADNTAYFGDNGNDCGAWAKVGFPIGIALKNPDLHHYVDYSFRNFHGALELFQNIANNK